MSPQKCLALAIVPALYLLPEKMDSREAKVQLLATAMQESGEELENRRQLGDGPARSLWQFEFLGIKGVLEHHSTSKYAQALCAARGVSPFPDTVLAAVEKDDILAAGFARLNYWASPKSMPSDEAGAWSLYLAVWRPGRPRPEKWARNYQLAIEAV